MRPSGHGDEAQVLPSSARSELRARVLRGPLNARPMSIFPKVAVASSRTNGGDLRPSAPTGRLGPGLTANNNKKSPGKTIRAPLPMLSISHSSLLQSKGNFVAARNGTFLLSSSVDLGSATGMQVCSSRSARRRCVRTESANRSASIPVRRDKFPVSRLSIRCS